MKLSLVVAQGVHAGKVIPITTPHFLIGRDPECQLRPASQAISKKHAEIVVQAGKVRVKDYGSTNGTFVNDEKVEGERELKSEDKLKVGPLDFVVRIEVVAAKPAPVAVAAAAPAKAVAAPTKADPAPSAATTDEGLDADFDAVDDGGTNGPKSDRIAAMLLDMGGGEEGATTGTDPNIPDGTTIMELQSLGADGKPVPAKKSDPNNADTSSAAQEILRKYMRRPRG